MESTELVPFRERLTQHDLSDLEGSKLAPKLSDKPIQDEATCSTSDVRISGNLSRTCRICNKQFSSGRALAGHMRVHGPLFTMASMSSRSCYGFPALNLARTREDEEQDFTRFNDDENEGSPSLVDELDAESDQEDFLLRGHASSISQASSGRNGGDKVTLYHSDNVYGEVDAGHAYDGEEEEALDSIESRSLTFKYNQRISCSAGTAEEARTEENITASRKSPSLYQLRHNPKRSRWFPEQEFAFEASIDHLGKSPSVNVEAAGCVCSECGKTFWSERALFGHMRCHPDRDKRGMISPEGSSELPADAILERNRRKGISVPGKVVSGSLEMQIGSKIRPDDSSKRGTGEIEPSAVSRKETTPASAGFDVRADVKLIADERDAKVILGVEEIAGCAKYFPGTLNGVIAAAHWQSAGKRSRRKVTLSKAEIMEIREARSSTAEDEPALTSETISLELEEEEQEIATPDFLILLADAAKKIEEEAALLISKEKYPRRFKDESRRAKDLHHMNGDHLHREDENSGEDEGVPSTAPDNLVTGYINGKYECTTCKKSFNSHQALGGHRASHKKTKSCFAHNGSSAEASEEHLFDEERLELQRVGEKGVSMMMRKKRRRKQEETQQVGAGHACSICHRVFLTGQALGGHKRCHWSGEKPSETVASVASTTKQTSWQSQGQFMAGSGIDLNLPAPIDGNEDADADEAGFGSTYHEIPSIHCKISDRESEIEKQAAGGSTSRHSNEIAGLGQETLRERWQQ